MTNEYKERLDHCVEQGRRAMILQWLLDCMKADVLDDHDYHIIGGICIKHFEEANKKDNEVELQHVGYTDEQLGRNK